MVRRCYVKGCGYTFKSGGTVSFHSLPLSKPELLDKWMQFLGYSQDSLHSKKSVTICSNHFRENDYKEYTNNKVLLPNAVPSVRPCKKVLLTSSDKKDIHCFCRFCGIYNESEHLDIFSKDHEEYVLKINKYLPTIPIAINDGFPRKICKQCIETVNSFANFYSKAEETQTALKNMLNIVETNMERKSVCPDGDVKPVVIKQADVTVQFDNSNLRIKQQSTDWDGVPAIKQEPPPKVVPPKPSVKLKKTPHLVVRKLNDPRYKFAMEDGYFKCLLCDKMKFVSKRALNNHVKYMCILPVKEVKVS